MQERFTRSTGETGWIVIQGARSDVALDRLRRYARLDHPLLVPLCGARREGERIELRLGPVATLPAALDPAAALRVADLLGIAFGCGPEVAIEAAASRLGRPLALPGREFFWPRPGSPPSPPPRPRGAARDVALEASGIDRVLQRLRAMLERRGAAPALMRVGGPGGCGKTALLRAAAVEAGLLGAEVSWEMPARIEPGEAPLVVLLDRRAASLTRILASGSWIAASAVRRLVLLVAGEPGAEEPELPAGLELDRQELGPWPAAQLAGSVWPDGGVGESWGERVAQAAAAAGGSPRELRLRLRAELAGVAWEPAAKLEERLLGALPAAGREALQLAILGGPRLTHGTLALALAGPPPWEQLEGWLSDRELPAEHAAGRAQLPAALRPADPRALHRQLAEALAAQAAPEYALAWHRALAGGSDAELLEALSGCAQEPPGPALAVLAGLEQAGRAPGPRLRRLEAALLGRAGRIDEALERLEALAHDSGAEEVALEARLERAELLAGRGELRAAGSELAALRAAVARAGSDLSARFEFLEGFVLYRSGDLDAARCAYERGLAERGLSPVRRAEGLAGLGYLLVREPGGSRRGERLLREARGIYQSHGDRFRLSRVLSREASALARRGEMDRAWDKHQQALEAAEAAGDACGAAECHVDLSVLAFDRGQLARALRHVEAARRAFETAGDARAGALAHANRAGIRLELGHPQEAEPVLLEALQADQDSGRRWQEAHDWRLLGLASLGLGRPAEARGRFARAQAIFEELQDDEALAELSLGTALERLESEDFGGALAAAQAGLRGLVSRPGGSLGPRLRLLAAWAWLRQGGEVGVARFVVEAVRAAARSADPTVRAEAALVEALASEVGAVQVSRFECAIEAAEAQERPAVLARTLAAALRHAAAQVAPERVRGWIARLRELHADPALAPRLRLLGVREGDGELPSPQALREDGLLRLEELLRGADTDLEGVLLFLASRVPLQRAAWLEPEADGGLRVVARLLRGQSAPESLRLALLLGERARLTATPAMLLDAGRDARAAELEEVRAWSTGAALAVPGGPGLLLYLERARSTPPFLEPELRFVEALARRCALEEREVPRRAAGPACDAQDDLGLLGSSPALARLRDDLRRLAAFDIPVFLSGESGTGKELAARALHRLSRRARGPFLALNCAAVPETLLEAELFGHVRGAFSGAVGDHEGVLGRVDGGILLLDEVGELSAAFQAKLLRAVELGEYRPLGSTQLRRADVRFLSATHRDMLRAVREGGFREDLYFRLLSTAVVELPPLRERGEDLALLASAFLERESARHAVAAPRLTPAALAALEGHRFPGNVRELERLIAGLVARCAGRRIEREDVEQALGLRAQARVSGGEGRFEEARRHFERAYLARLLERHAGNRTHAARSAGIARQTLLAMLKRHGIEREGPRRVAEAPPPGDWPRLQR